MAKRKEDIDIDTVVGAASNVAPEDVAASFAADTRPVSASRSYSDPDDDDIELERLEREVEREREQAQAIGAGSINSTEIPTNMEGILRALTQALAQIAQGSANSQNVAMKALESASRQTQPDNKLSPMVSTLNPQGELGYPKPKLKCAMHIPWEVENESVTWEEAELLNMLEAGTYTVRKNDGSKARVEIKTIENLNGRVEKLFMNCEMGFSQENFWQMPRLTDLLRQVLSANPKTRDASRKVLTMDDRFAMVNAGELQVSEGRR